MKKTFLFLTIFFIIIAVLAGIRLSFDSDRQKELKATFVSQQGKKIEVSFFFAERPMADVMLNDGRSFLLYQGLSASGARYVNPDESFVLWIKGETAFIEENGKRTFDGLHIDNK